MNSRTDFRVLFERATGRAPYPYQERLTAAPRLPSVLHAPTGAGKTNAVLLAWLHRCLHADPATRAATPRRLVYALPMRVLVEQVWRNVDNVLSGLGLEPEQVGRHLLMGGEADDDWVRDPERPAVLVGTVDMLLSRALNRGYVLGRPRWPMDFGLLNADCLWVLDEMQLMGGAATTAAQLEGLRAKLGTWRGCHTLWLSATVDTRPLVTVDRPLLGEVFQLGPEDVTGALAQRLTARKMLERRQGDAAAVAVAEHAPESVTLLVHNTVKAAVDTHRRLRRRPPAGGPELLLLHSRFRPPDRQRLTKLLTEQTPANGRVVSATQVVEAGVDLSARLLVTEAAPWSSIVQRLGRCNRYGEEPDGGLVRWLDVARPEPYRQQEVDLARSILSRLEGRDVSPQALAALQVPEPPLEPVHVLRLRDLRDLFDTAPDLSGSDLDVSRFIRDADDPDCRVLWRDWSGEEPPADMPRPATDELCPAPVSELRKLVKDGRETWTWDAVDARWRRVRDRDVRPGLVLLLRAAQGGYSPEVGWDPASRQPVLPLPPAAEASQPPDANWADPLSGNGRWLELEAHTRHVVAHAGKIVQAALEDAAPPQACAAVDVAARAHDAGKALERFQDFLLQCAAEGADREARRSTIWAKSDCRVRPREHNPRHELASALSLLQSGRHVELLPQPWADLALFLVAAHHGKARVTIRPWPQDEPGRQVLGVEDGAALPEVRVDGLVLPAATLSLAPLRMGDGEHGASWAARMLALRDHPELGPFRIAHLEALLRAADWRASEEESHA